MSRTQELQREVKEEKRRVSLVKALEFELVGTLETQGIQMVGFAVKFDAWECLMTLKAEIGGKRQVAFVGADSVISCILKAVQAAQYDKLKWRVDVYTSK